MKNRVQAVGVGLATLDVLIRLKEMPSWERTSRFEGFRLEGGGWVATAMVAAARLGARVGYVGTAGTDEAADIKLKSMVDCDVDLSRLVRRPGPEDQVAIVYVHAESGERVFSVMQAGPRVPVQVEELDRDYVTAADVLHIDIFHPQAALKAMREFDFDTVMYPVNYALHYHNRFEADVLAEARKREMGIIALKVMCKGRWPAGADRTGCEKCWYQPVVEPDIAAKALSWSLAQGITVAIPPGEEALYRIALDAVSNCSPPTAEDAAMLEKLAGEYEPIFTV